MFIHSPVIAGDHLDLSLWLTVAWRVLQFPCASSTKLHVRSRRSRCDFASSRPPIRERCWHGTSWSQWGAYGEYVCSIHNQYLASSTVPWSGDVHGCQYLLASSSLAASHKEKHVNFTFKDCRKSRILTANLAYRSDWWRMKRFVRFFTIFGRYAGRIVILGNLKWQQNL